MTENVTFICCDYRDRHRIKWIYRKLSKFSIPSGLKELSIRSEIKPIFFAEYCPDLPLSKIEEYNTALIHSQILIVVCSPHAAMDRNINNTILKYKCMGRNEIVAIIVDGEPNGDLKGIPGQECFPEAIKYRVDSNGIIDHTLREEPLAADMQVEKKISCLNRILSGVLGTRYDFLANRRNKLKKGILVFFIIATILFMVFILLLITLIQIKTITINSYVVAGYKKVSKSPYDMVGLPPDIYIETQLHEAAKCRFARQGNAVAIWSTKRLIVVNFNTHAVVKRRDYVIEKISDVCFIGTERLMVFHGGLLSSIDLTDGSVLDVDRYDSSQLKDISILENSNYAVFSYETEFETEFSLYSFDNNRLRPVLTTKNDSILTPKRLGYIRDYGRLYFIENSFVGPRVFSLSKKDNKDLQEFFITEMNPREGTYQNPVESNISGNRAAMWLDHFLEGKDKVDKQYLVLMEMEQNEIAYCKLSYALPSPKKCFLRANGETLFTLAGENTLLVNSIAWMYLKSVKFLDAKVIDEFRIYKLWNEPIDYIDVKSDGKMISATTPYGSVGIWIFENERD